MSTETKVRHTPGPWKAVRYRGDWVIEVYNRESGFGSTVAELRPEQSSLPAEEHEANAHVIAAAPDMLEALEAAIAWGKHPLRLESVKIQPWFGRAEAAIAKAKGGAA